MQGPQVWASLGWRAPRWRKPSSAVAVWVQATRSAASEASLRVARARSAKRRRQQSNPRDRFDGHRSRRADRVIASRGKRWRPTVEAAGRARQSDVNSRTACIGKPGVLHAALRAAFGDLRGRDESFSGGWSNRPSARRHPIAASVALSLGRTRPRRRRRRSDLAGDGRPPRPPSGAGVLAAAVAQCRGQLAAQFLQRPVDPRCGHALLTGERCNWRLRGRLLSTD